MRNPAPDLASVLGAQALADWLPRYNIAPTQQVPVMQLVHGERRLRWMRWGLVPGWSAGPDARYAMHNARIEGIETKPAYRGPIRRRRCLVPASGWYEWQQRKSHKQPWFIAHRGQSLMCLAALWDQWQRDDETIVSCSILTGPAMAPINAIHARMPVVVPAEHWDDWLAPENNSASAMLATLQALGAESLQADAVSSHVNNAGHDDPGCMETLQPVG